MLMNLRPAHLLFEYLRLMQYDIHKAMMREKLNRISSAIQGRWLDIGAGDQPYRKYFSGSDEYLTTNTKRHYSDTDFGLLAPITTFWIDDGKSLPVPDNSLDGVACFQVLSVMDKPADFFREINRVLKPGGKLVLTTDFLYPVWSGEDRYRHTAYNLRQLASETGFENPATESFGGFGSMVYAVLMRYMRSFPEIWKTKKTIAKAISAIPYMLLLLLLPLISLKGLIIFLIEKRNTGNTNFTFNLLLEARKKQKGE
jgi:SAM-dependent methyltransferase